MKPWMKFAMWFLLGAGLGFFTGQQVGSRKTSDECYDTGFDDGLNAAKNYTEYLRKKYGYPEPEEEILDEDPDMPMEEPVIPEPEDEPEPDGDIPQFHPSYLTPVIVTEQEYDNRGDLDEERLLYYCVDEVLYNTRTQQIIPDDEYPATIGVGTLSEFRVGPGQPKETIFVINENNCRYRIDRMDDAFCDAVDGTCAPEEDDDYWDDV